MKSLKALFDMNNLWHKPNNLIFASSRNPSKSFSQSWYRHHLKRLCVRVGLNPNLYSGHSGRAGGATDLLNQNVPYAYIKLLGRWKSDIALIYYRDKAATRRAVSVAFSSIATSTLPAL